MLPLEYNFERYVGDNGNIEIRWLSQFELDDGSFTTEPINLTNGVAELSIVKNLASGVILTLVGIIDDPLTGIIKFPITPEETRLLLDPAYQRNTLRYDLQYLQDSGLPSENRTTLLDGKITFVGDITRIGV